MWACDMFVSYVMCRPVMCVGVGVGGVGLCVCVVCDVMCGSVVCNVCV